MTLVVARLEREKAHVFSDTKLSYGNGQEIPYLNGMIKTIIVQMEVCISFAGDVEEAKKALLHIMTEKFNSVIEILDYLIKVHTDSNFNVEFGIISNIDRNPVLFCIKDGKLGTYLSNFWLGEGYDQYQKYYHQDDENVEVKHRMRMAMEKVIHDGNKKSIGGFLISVSTDHDSYSFTDSNGTRPISGFSYDLFFSYNISNVKTIQNMKKGEWYDIKPADQNNFMADSVSTFKSISPGYPGVAFYYRQAMSGFIFCPNLQIKLNNNEDIFKLIKIENIDAKVFCTEVKDSYDIDLTGFIDNGDGSFTYV